MGTKHMHGSEEKLSLEFDEGEYCPGNESSTYQRADHGQEKKSIQDKPDGARGVVPAFAQALVPRAVQPGVQQKDDSQKHAQPFMGDTARVRRGHEQEKKKNQENVCEGFCIHVHR